MARPTFALFFYFCIASVIAVGYADNIPDLRCYDCSPDLDVENCVEPRKLGARSSFCKAPEQSGTRSVFKKHLQDIDKTVLEPRARGQTLPYRCFSMYFKSNTTDVKSGIYRGCTELPQDVQDTCQFLNEEYTDIGNITYCQTCARDNCNNHKAGDGGASASVAASIAVLLVNILVCFYVL